MNHDEFMKIHAKAWEDFNNAAAELEEKYNARMNALRKEREKIIDAALKEAHHGC